MMWQFTVRRAERGEDVAKAGDGKRWRFPRKKAQNERYHCGGDNGDFFFLDFFDEEHQNKNDNEVPKTRL